MTSTTATFDVTTSFRATLTAKMIQTGLPSEKEGAVFFLGKDPMPIMVQNFSNKQTAESKEELIKKTLELLGQMVQYSLEHPKNIDWYPQNVHCRIVVGRMGIYIRKGHFEIRPYESATETFGDHINYASDLETALNTL
jgi:hypothetical protein